MSEQLYQCNYTEKCDEGKLCGWGKPHKREQGISWCNHAGRYVTDQPHEPAQEQLWVCDHWQTCGKMLFRNCRFRKPTIHAHFADGNKTYDCAYHSDGLRIHVAIVPYPPKEAVMPEYELLKPVSIKALEDSGACERELHRFAFEMVKRLFDGAYECDLTLTNTIRFASQCEGGIAFLKEKGFVKVKEPERTYHIGQRFRYLNVDYILAAVDAQIVSMINLCDGSRNGQEVKVTSPTVYEIPSSDLTVFLNQGFELIK